MANFSQVGSNYLLSNLDVQITGTDKLLYLDSSGNIVGKTLSELGVTDSKVTNTLNNTSKAFVTGTTSSETNTSTQIFDNGIWIENVAGRLRVGSLNIADGAYLTYDTTNKAIKISFA